MLLKKGHVNSSNTLFHKVWGRFPYRQRPFQGASDGPLHSLRSLQGLTYDANPLGVTLAPLQTTMCKSVFSLSFIRA